MSVQLFRLRGVPDDEADDIRQLLTENGFDYYETPGSNWGLGMPAIWLNDKQQLVAARALIDQYQTQRGVDARAAHEQQKNEGKQHTLIDEIKAQPLRFAIYLLAAIVVLYLSTKPFLSLGL